MKQLIFVVALLYLSAAQAQQEPLFTQYQTNAFVINPAVAGTEQKYELRMNYRSQWQRFPGAPKTATLSYHGTVDEKSSFGGLAFTDIVGPSVRSGVQLSYAFRMPIGYGGIFGQNMLSFGLGGKFMQYSFRADQVYFFDRTDPAIYETAGGLRVGDVAFGVFFYNDRFYGGISAPNLIQSDFGTDVAGLQSRSLISKLYRHYFALAGYKLAYDEMTIEPSILIKKVQTAPYQIEGTVKFHLVDEKLMLGLAYRTDWLGSLMFGFKAKGLDFVYSADFMLLQQRTNNVFGTTHEFSLGLNLGEYWRQFYQEK